MPTPNEFKFKCPACDQHIVANAEWSGRGIDCPSCHAHITIPAPTKVPESDLPVLPPTGQTGPKLPGGENRVVPPADVPKSPAVQTTTAPPSSTVSSNAKTGDVPADLARKAASVTPQQPERLHIAALTPMIKLEIVRAVRRRLADESSWLPGNVKGANAYAAKGSGGEPVLVDASDPAATRFSLMGAFLLEMSLLQVVRTAVGRTKLLDHEIPDAIREVLLDEMSEEEHAQADQHLADKDLMSISHAQCLAALNVLEALYSERMDHTRVERAKRRLGNVRLPELVRKLETKAPISPEDVATALYHELMEVRRRLERLESRISENK